MRRSGTILALVTLLLFGFSVTKATAANRSGAFNLSPMIGGHVFDGDMHLKDRLTYGLAFGYNYTPHWATELFLNYTNTEAKVPGSNPDADVWVYELDGLYHFLPDSTIVPYLEAGAGAVTVDRKGEPTETNFMLNYGIGLKIFLTDDLALRGDIRHVVAFDQGLDEWNKTDNHLLYSAGLTYQFGGTRPAVAPVQRQPEIVPHPAPAPAEVKDSDGDGVPDDRDQCPDTRKGVMVDAKGCPISLNIHIEFDFDKAEIKPEFHDELRRAAEFIKTHPAPKILIAGYTDNIGTPEYNQKLSERRAAAVRQYLIDNFGIEADKLVARGYGESRPIASNATPEGRQENRRTEIVCCVFIPEE